MFTSSPAGPLKAIPDRVDPTTMAADRFEVPDLQAVASVLAGLARPPVVEIEYEGTVPPLELFSNLGALGFAGLVPQPPPSASIDWSSGGAGGGPRINPYRATATGVFDGPTGDREAAATAARMVLGRLAAAQAARAPRAVGDDVAFSRIDAVAVPAARRSELPPPPAARPTRPQTGPTVTPLRPVPAPAPPRPTAATPSPPPLPGPVAATSPAARRDRVVVVVVDPSMAPDLRDLLERAGTVVEEVPVTWTEEMTYRGQKSETRHRAVRFHATVAADVCDRLLAELSRTRLRSVEVRD